MDDPAPPPKGVIKIAEPEDKRKPLGALSHDYKGFVAGVFSGIAKLTGERVPSFTSPMTQRPELS